LTTSNTQPSKPTKASKTSPPTSKGANRNIDAHREETAGEFLTTNQGVRIGNDQNTLRAGVRGPALLEDFAFREKITHFDHERIPERVVHARGAGVHGYFQVYESMAEYTCAQFLQDPATITPVFVRFSTVAGSRGSADTVRDVRGFATKFYTEEGNFDLVGNNIPIFFIQDAIKFPDLIHAVKPDPNSEMPQAASAHDTFWDFVWLTPESTHMIMWHLSDRALPRSFSMMEGFGVHTFRLINEAGVSRFVKFHWKPLLGVHSLVWDEAQKLAGKDADYLRRDMWEAIERGDYFEFEFGIQIIEEADEHKFPFDLLDATKIWPEEMVPVRRIGKMTLNRNPDNFFAETEQVAFHTGHVVRGIDFSNDPLLQGRLFSYLDTQLIRLGGPNFAEIPINRPLNEIHNTQRDGHMRQTINPGQVSYGPNSLGGGRPRQALPAQRGYASYAERIEAPKVRERSPSFDDHFGQATLFWNSQSEAEKEHIVLAFRFELGKVESLEVRERVVDLFTNVDLELARKVAAGIGVADPTTTGGIDGANQRLRQGWDTFGVTDRPGEKRSGLPASAPELSMANTPKGNPKGRKVAVLAADGVDGDMVTQMETVLKQAGLVVEVIAPHLGSLQSTKGNALPVTRSLLTVASVMYDAVLVAGGQQSVTTLKESGDALHFIGEAFKHCKAIAAIGEGVDLLLAADCIGALGTTEQDGAALASEGILALRQAKNITVVAEQFAALIGQHRFFTRLKRDQMPA
jgi:catalase